MKEELFVTRVSTILLLMMLMVPLILQIAPSVAQEEVKTTFNIIASYNPPPVGHFNFFVHGAIMGGWRDLVVEPMTHYYLANGSYIPGIAENWTISEDYMTFTLHLRKGVLFHDRHELTADDVIATYYSGVYLFKMRPWKYLKNITKVDDYTLIFYMKEPNDYVPFYVLWHFSVLPSTQYKQFSDRVLAKIKEGYDIFTNETAFQDIIEDLKEFRPSTFIGTGPYYVKSVTATEIILEKFAEYWGGVPPIDEVRITNVKSPDVAWSLRLAGEVDWYWGTPTPEYYDKLRDECPWFTLVSIRRPLGPAIYFNYKKYPFNITEFKWAIAYAINRTALALIQYPIGAFPEEYQLGFSTYYLETTLNETFINEYIKGPTYNFRYDYNVTKANEILDNLGFIDTNGDGIREFPNGTNLEFEFLGSGRWLVPEAMEAVATMLEEVGIKLTVRLIEPGTWFAADGPFYMGRYYISAFFGVASPDFMFDEMYVKYSTLFPGCGFPDMVTVPWREKPVNVTDLTLRLQTFPAGITEEERDEFRAILTFVSGYYLPKISLFTRPVIIAMNTEKFAGWPSPEDTTYWNSLASYMTHGLSYLFRWGLLKPKFRLTISVTPSEAGTTTPSSGEYSYVKGETVTVSATPAEGYEFKYWLLDGKQVSMTETYTVTMDASHELVAVFEKLAPPPPPYGLYAGVGAVIAAIIIAAAIFLTRR